MELGTKVRLIQSWRAYSVGNILEQGYEADLGQLVAMGIAIECNDDGTDMRPARLTRNAAKKVADGVKGLFGAT